MDLISYKIVETLTKTAVQLPRYQVLSVLDKTVLQPSIAVSQTGPLN